VDGPGPGRHARRGAGIGSVRVRVRRRGRSADGDRSHGRHAGDHQGASAMRSTPIAGLCVAGVSALALVTVSAQQKPDPRVGLKPGLHDAGEAAWNLERVSSLPKPDGFFDPKAPGGNPAPPERDPKLPPEPEAPFDPVASNRLGFTNSDLAFQGNHTFVGNYHGFNTYDVERPNRPKLLASVVCPGGQG